MRYRRRDGAPLELVVLDIDSQQGGEKSSQALVQRCGTLPDAVEAADRSRWGISTSPILAALLARAQASLALDPISATTAAMSSRHPFAPMADAKVGSIERPWSRISCTPSRMATEKLAEPERKPTGNGINSITALCLEASATPISRVWRVLCAQRETH
jgi:hypothetical protein